ncbi:MAG: TonB-dependent receptor [Bacteroidota bacterium]
MRIHQLSLVLTILLLSFSQLVAQTVQVAGKVTDPGTEKPVVGATIRILETRQGAFTDANGLFEIAVTASPNDSLSLRISYTGYEVYEIRKPAKEWGEAPVKVVLRPENFTTDDVVITATRGLEQRAQDVTVSIEVLKTEAIDLQAQPRVDDVITMIPGVENLDGQISIRGSSGYAFGIGSRVQVLLDGLPLLSGDASFPELSLIPVDNVTQIEVLKGASSVLYGSGALGGVINVLTGRPTEKPRTSIRLRGGLFDQPANPDLDWDGSDRAQVASAHIFHSRRIGEVDLTLQTDLIKETGYIRGTDKEEARGIMQLAYQPKSVPGLKVGTNASFRVDSSGSPLYWSSYYPVNEIEGEGPTADTTILEGALVPSSDAAAFRRQLNTRLAVDPYIKYLSPKGHLYWLRTRYLRNVNQNNSGQSASNYLIFTDFMYQKTIFDNLGFTVGASWQYGQANADSLYAGRKIGRQLGAYAQLDAKMGRLNTSLGIRLETVQIDTIDRQTEPVVRVGVNYELWRGANLRASFGQGFRFPSVAERYVSTTGGGLQLVPNPELKPELGTSVEMAIRQGFKFSNNKKFRAIGYIDLAFFQQDYDNMVEFGLRGLDPDSLLNLQFVPVFTSANVTRARIRGLELTLNGRMDWGKFFVNFNGGYTLIDPQNLEPAPEENQIDLSGFEEIEGVQELFDLIVQLTDPTFVDNPEVLKYRSRRLIRASTSIGYSRYSLTANVRYRSFVESIDQYLFLVIKDLNDFRRDINPDGVTTVDLIGSADINENLNLSLNLDNAFNSEYMDIPGLLAPQRRLTMQVLYRF